MSKRAPWVDFGPVALPVSDAGQDSWHPPGIFASPTPGDALKLKRLLQVGAGDSGDPPDESTAADNASNAGIQSLAPGQEAGNAMTCLRLAASISTAATRIAARIELQLDPDWLPDARLVIEKERGELRFDLCIGDLRALECLSGQLQSMANQLGRQLQRPLTLRLLDAKGSEPVREVCWHQGSVA